ncbi:hypothetical protein [Azonexus hydrophilus]
MSFHRLEGDAAARVQGNVVAAACVLPLDKRAGRLCSPVHNVAARLDVVTTTVTVVTSSMTTSPRPPSSAFRRSAG